MTRPPTRRVIFLRYLVVLLLLVGGAVLVSNGIGLYLTYRGTQSRLSRLQREKVARAQSAALGPLVALNEQTNRSFRTGLRDVDAPGVRHPSARQREAGYVAATRDASRSSYAGIAYVDPRGRETVRVATGRVLRPTPGSLAGDPVVRAARARGIALGPAYAARDFDGRRVLRASLAVTEARSPRGVILSQLNLDFLSLSIGGFTNTGPRYVYYIVDGTGHLVARSDAPEDASLRDLSGLAEVQAALREGEGPRPADQQAVRGRDIGGRPVLATSAALPLVGWHLIALQPDPGSQGPLTSAIIRTAILLTVFLGLAVVASFLLARRMTRPIRAIQAGAARIGEGSLDERIEVHTGDELESLAEEFNRMAARLGDSYETLEQRVDDRTRDLVEALTQLERVSGEKTRFLANMSHELRTPLNAIINMSDVLRDASAGPLTPRQVACAEDIYAAGRHLQALVTDILDLARIEAGRMELDTEALDVAECLQDGLRVVRGPAESKGLAVSLEVDPEVGIIEADARKLRQVVFNLLANAVRFTPPGGSIEVSARRRDSQVGDRRIRHGDRHRSGRSRAHLRRVRAGRLTGRTPWRHRARPRARTAPGRAPRRPDPARERARVGKHVHRRPSPPHPVRPPAVGAGTDDADGGVSVGAPLESDRRVILVVDDTPANLRVLEAVLEPAGHAVRFAESGAEALAMVAESAPDLVLLDVVMPDMDGHEVCRRLRAHPETQALPIILITASEEQQKLAALEAGADDFVLKPFDRAELLARVRSLLRIKEAHDTIRAQAAELAELNRTLERA